MNWFSLAATLWIMALLVFHLSPLNDPLAPASEMNRYHPLNVRIREKVDEELAKEGDERVAVIEWVDIAPYCAATWVTTVCVVVYLLLAIALHTAGY